LLLINPPVARSTEAPLALARLAAALRARGLPVRCLDLSAEGAAWLLDSPVQLEAGAPGGLRLAWRRRGRSAAALRSPAGYRSLDGYRRSVDDLQRSLGAASAPAGVVVSLADYRDGRLSPLLRADLAAAAAAYDANPFHPLFVRRLDEGFAARDVRTVGIALGFLSQALCAFALAGLVRARFPGVRIVLGGALINSWAAAGYLAPDESFGGLVDAVLPGRGEDALPAYLERVDPLHAAGAPRLAARAGPGAGAPDFADFIGGPYFAPETVLPYNFSWGCPWKRCTFCPETAEDSAYVGIASRAASAELAALAAAHRPGLFHFTDNEVAPLYLKALADTPPGAPWYGFARFDRRLLDPGFCRALAASGCLMLQLGLESADQRVLDGLAKGTRLAEIRPILANLKAAGIAVYVYVLFGTAAEDEAAALATRDFLAEQADAIDFVNAAIFNLPIAGAAASGLDHRQFYAADLSLYREFVHPSGWNRPEVRAFLRGPFLEPPAVAALVARTPPVFTSSHAVYFRRRG
jgi:hypothetical protein